MSILDRFSSKLQMLRDFYTENKRQPYNEHGFIASAGIQESEIRAIENEYHFILPAEYRDFLKRFGDGGVGPGNNFIPLREAITPTSKMDFPLSRPFLGSLSPAFQRMTQKQKDEEYRRLLIDWDAIPGNHGCLQICDYGCAMYAVLIVNGPFCGKVWMLSGDTAYYGPFGGAEALHDESWPSEWQATETPKDYSFFEWYESWLDGELKMVGMQP